MADENPPVIAPVLFTEARLNIEPTSSTSILHIPTDNSSSIFASRKRPRGQGNGASLDEDEYARRHLPSESSIFFRAKNRTPRNILWRVLDDNKILELQAVDLTQDRKAARESLLTFSISFANPIRPRGVAFADSSSHDILEVFVLTSGNELFTFSFRRELFLRSTVPSASEFDTSSCFKTFALSSFSFRNPYKLVALSDLQLVVSLHDGALLRLERRPADSGSAWRETFFHEGGWGSSLRGLIPWKGQNTIRYGNIDLAPTTAAAIAASPSGDHVFIVTLDHTLKSWNASTGKVGFQVDLLGEPRPEGRIPHQFLINPNHDSLMRIVDVKNKPDGDSFYCVVYSPKDHQFKFWAVRDPDSAEYGLRDIHPELKLVPPIDELMDTKIWQLADFELQAGAGWTDTKLWIRARSGAQCQMFNVTFDLLGTTEDVEHAWKHRWSSVSEGSLGVKYLSNTPEFRHLSQDSPEDSSQPTSDEWLSFLTYPGRFAPSSLETALHIYQTSQGLKTSSKAGTGNSTFQNRLRNAITSKIGLTRTADGQVDTNRYVRDTNNQWKAFFGLVKHLHQRRADSLSLVLDQDTGLSWSIRADFVAPIRLCSETEVTLLNEDMFAQEDDSWIENNEPLEGFFPPPLGLSSARLLSAANIFRAGLSVSFNRNFGRLASAFALRDAGNEENNRDHRSRKSQNTPLQQLYERCDFGNEVGDDEFERLTASVQDIGGLGQLENDLFETALSNLTEDPRGQEQDAALSHYGDKVTTRVAQDTLLEGRNLLLDLLALITFMSQDLETDELARDFKAMDLYTLIANKLREYDVLLWMASNTRTESITPARSPTKDGVGSAEDDTAGPSMTILESIFIGDWSSIASPKEPLSALVTYWSRAWTFGSNLGVEYDGVTTHIMSNLLKAENYRLAFDFARYLPNNAWATYLKGRLYLGEGEYAAAAASFRRASEDLSQLSNKRISPMETVDTAHLLSGTDRQCFNAGIPRFYLHCCALFEEVKLPAFAADFAALALNDIEEQNNDETLDSSMMNIDSKKRGSEDSPVAVRVNLAMEEIRLLKVSELKEDILSRLFNASLQTARYQTAFEALTKITNPAIKRASLMQLLTSILSTNPPLLLSFPFPSDLVAEVDSALLSLARKHPASIPVSADAPGTSYQGILYSWRITQENYRGAAESLYERLQLLRAEQQARDEDDEPVREAEEVLDTYLLLINTLACCGPEEAWILAEPSPPGGKRKIVTLNDVRAEYQAELDRRSEIAHGRFALFTSPRGERMEVDGVPA